MNNNQNRANILNRAVSALQSGNAKAAFKDADALAAKNPKDIDAHILLSQAAPPAGKTELALKRMTKAISANAANEALLICQGNLFAAGKQFTEAEGAFRKAVETFPKSVGARMNLANVLLQTGKCEQAAKEFDVSRRMGGGWQAELGLANALMMMGDLAKAEGVFQSVLKSQPNHPGVHNSLGRVYIERGFFGRAEFHLEKAISIQPKNPGVLLNLGSLRRRQERIDEAVDLTRRAIELAPGDVNGLSNLADILEKANRLEEAKSTVNDGLARFPGHVGLLVQAARLDRRDGDVDGAIGRLSGITDFKGDIKNAAASHQELGILYDKKGDYAEAYDHFIRAKENFTILSRQWNISFDMFFDQIKAMHDFVRATDFEVLEPLNTDDGRADPIFLFGFLRSGTTLLHQILDTHEDVSVVDEKPISIAAEESLAKTAFGYPEGIATLNEAAARQARDAYFETMETHLPEGSRTAHFVDKFPFNSARAPLLWRLFPNAKFIFAIRHPMDVCLSCFMQAFQPTAATTPFLSMEKTVQAYADLMDLWLEFSGKTTLNLISLRYEDLVANQEGISRELFDFLEIPWDDKALRFYEHAQQSKSVSNPSYHQVVRPIYSDAAERWRRYDAQLSEFYPQLDPYAEAFGYSPLSAAGK